MDHRPKYKRLKEIIAEKLSDLELGKYFLDTA